jgi:O-Antigen ligase
MSDDFWLPLAQVRDHRDKQLFLVLLGPLLLIYATLARDGAHLGIPLTASTGIYIGDLELLLGLALVMVDGSYRRWFQLPPLAWIWGVFFIWNAAQTLPYLSKYGLLALRDGAVWGYSLYAVIVYSQLLARPSGFVMLLNQFGRFARYYPFWIPLVAPVALFLPLWMLAPQALTGMMPHVVGAMAFVICRFVAAPRLWLWVLPIDVLLCGSQGRGALVAFFAALAVLWFLKPYRLRVNTRVIGAFAALGLIFALAAVVHVNFGVSISGRAVGPDQFVENIKGIFEQTGNPVLDPSRRHREELWDKIIDYTVHGPYFWTGKGYGINILADAHASTGDDPNEPPARSPENAHLNFLARSGVPGFLLWVILQLTWAVGIFRVHTLARRTGRRQTMGLMAFLLVYWTVFMVQAATSVIFEGPQGGIWFWTIFGVGTAAAQMVWRDHDFFERIDLRIGPRGSRAQRVGRPKDVPSFGSDQPSILLRPISGSPNTNLVQSSPG